MQGRQSVRLPLTHDCSARQQSTDFWYTLIDPIGYRAVGFGDDATHGSSKPSIHVSSRNGWVDMNMRRSAGVLLAITALLGWSSVAALTTSAAGATESPSASAAASHGAATPEAAVQQYLAAVAASNFDQVLSACAIQEMASGYRFDLAAERLNAFIFTSMWAPASYPFYAQVNADLQQGVIVRAVMYLSYSLLATEPLDPGSVITPVDDARAQQFISEVDPAQLYGLSVVDVRFPKASLEHDLKLQANYEANAKIYGADEQTERVALVSLGGTDYVVGFTLLRYGSSWFVAFPWSPLFGMTSTGIAGQMTRAEFEDQTSS
jgi:hypothetical protein